MDAMSERRNRPRRQKEQSVRRERRGPDRRRGERRHTQRVPAEILVEVETSGQRTYRRTANISMGGIGFHAPIPFRLGSVVSMTIRPAGARQPIRVTGEVIGVDESGRGNRVKFLDLAGEGASALEEHLELYHAPTRVGLAPMPFDDGTERGFRQVREGVLVLGVPGASREIRLRATDRVIGRDPREADIVIDHPTVSRRHAHVCLQNGRHLLTDLSSTNGIRFRGKPVRSLVLRDGMMFFIGQVEIQYLVTRSV